MITFAFEEATAIKQTSAAEDAKLREALLWNLEQTKKALRWLGVKVENPIDVELNVVFRNPPQGTRHKEPLGEQDHNQPTAEE